MGKREWISFFQPEKYENSQNPLIILTDLTQERTARNSDVLEEQLCCVLTLQAQLVQLPPLVEAGRVGINQEERHSVGCSLL